MSKIHLAANKGNNGTPLYAICAAKPGFKAGTVRRNSRTTYAHMSSPIASFEAFKAAPAADRCAHCMEAGLIACNRQRAAKGKAPLTRLICD